ncbi:hypothetical protein VTJ04DRAFT_3266 [Mycothermus thermophilus]|uniref:uncharacterized protein n=1 Tax=Humicola insolens TaxID=85995 RepID=UPI003744973C
MPCSADPCSWRSPAEEHFTCLSCFGTLFTFLENRGEELSLPSLEVFAPRPTIFQVDVNLSASPFPVLFAVQGKDRSLSIATARSKPLGSDGGDISQLPSLRLRLDPDPRGATSIIANLRDKSATRRQSQIKSSLQKATATP